MNNSSRPSIAIAGAGLAGLCLAQSLHRAGIDVRVYERDSGPFARRQGYRITVDKDGRAALRRCVPPNLYELISTVAGAPGGYFRITNKDLRDAVTVRFDENIPDQAAVQMDRQTLRAILLRGLEDRVHFGKGAVGVEQDSSGAVLHLSDGGSTRADVVVGADGVGSVLRATTLPGHDPVDSGMYALYGRTPLRVRGRSMVPQALTSSGVLAIGDRPGRCMFFTSMRFGEQPSAAFRRLAPGHDAPVDDDYVMWGLVFSGADDPFPDQQPTSSQLHEFAVGLVGEFHSVAKELIAESQPEYTMKVKLTAAPRPRGWQMSRVTLVGDAVHAMPPLGAHGGNTALRDAALLAEKLEHAVAHGASLEHALSAYQDEMVPYAFQSVDEASKQLRRLTGSNPVQRWILLRALPRLHRATVS
ncbi:FAD-dependent monooxygenase [Nocardia panacis]|uniref:FAD-dependent monooxygenase n=1 Tax=Nocardia panacis TaxID=2340916 RepID=A0A3A4KDG5_9NOCA|nr:FAD-dependent monooxygenase [Nocardia panacis]